jgi:hypothetical protein
VILLVVITNLISESKIKFTEKEFIEKLRRERPEIEYVSGYTQLQKECNFICECGRPWITTPSAVIISNRRCAKCAHVHQVFHDKSFYENKKTILYYVKLNNLYKVGICLFKKDPKSDIKYRFQSDINFRNIKLEIINYEVFEDGSKAYLKEQEIIMKNVSKKYFGENILRGGNTELFEFDINPF